jgi:hypothetical protein
VCKSLLRGSGEEEGDEGVSTITTLAAGASGFGGATKVDGDDYSRS